MSCVVSKHPMFHQWEGTPAGPWHAIMKDSGQDLVNARRNRFELEQTQGLPALAVSLSSRVISFHNLRKGAQSLSRHVSPHGFDHWMEHSMAAPPFLARVKRLLSNRLSVCRLRIDACHVLPAARSHLIMQTLVLHDRSVMSHVSLSEPAYLLERRWWCRSSIEYDLIIVSSRSKLALERTRRRSCGPSTPFLTLAAIIIGDVGCKTATR
jgi:hypothetical protein